MPQRAAVPVLVLVAICLLSSAEPSVAKRAKCSDPQVFCQGVPGGKCWVGDYGRRENGSGGTIMETNAEGTVTKSGKKCKYEVSKEKSEIATRPPGLFDIANEGWGGPESTGSSAVPGTQAAGRIWDLGTLEGGKVYPTSITAENLSCPGRHTFVIELQDQEWFQVPGNRVLREIGVGESLSSEALVDLRNAEPGSYTASILILCMTCPPPPRCTQNISRIDASVQVKPAGGM